MADTVDLDGLLKKLNSISTVWHLSDGQPFAELARDTATAIVSLQQQVADLREDKARMDWLVSMHVEVRTPLLYGSSALFVAQQVSDEEDAEHRTSLREQIDQNRARKALETKP